MRRVRQVHVWLGVLFAPTILFFACSGALMTLGLHKNRSSSEGISVIARMAEIHRKQSAFPGPPKPASEKQKDESASSAASAKAATDGGSRVMFRAFVVLMAVGLVVTTVLGLVMAFTQTRQRTQLVWAFAIGLVLPVAVLLL